MKIITFFFTILIFVACSGKQNADQGFSEENRAVSDADVLTFQDSFGGYKIDYPKFWKLEDHSQSKDMIRADIYKDNNVGFQIRMYKTQNFKTFTDSYINNFLHEMQDHWKGTIKEEKRNYSGTYPFETCIVWIRAEKQNGEKWLFKEYIFQNTTKVIALQSGVYLQYEDIYETELDKIASSFRFLK